MIFNGETYKNYFQIEISCRIFKLTIFSKSFVDLMSHIIREYADEEIKYFLYFSPHKIMGVLLSDFMVSSLCAWMVYWPDFRLGWHCTRIKTDLAVTCASCHDMPCLWNVQGV